MVRGNGNGTVNSQDDSVFIHRINYCRSVDADDQLYSCLMLPVLRLLMPTVIINILQILERLILTLLSQLLLSSTESLFNGVGVVYENNDMRPNFTWSYVQVYIRKMLFDSAKQYVPVVVTNWEP